MSIPLQSDSSPSSAMVFRRASRQVGYSRGLITIFSLMFSKGTMVNTCPHPLRRPQNKSLAMSIVVAMQYNQFNLHQFGYLQPSMSDGTPQQQVLILMSCIAIPEQTCIENEHAFPQTNFKFHQNTLLISQLLTDLEKNTFQFHSIFKTEQQHILSISDALGRKMTHTFELIFSPQGSQLPLDSLYELAAKEIHDAFNGLLVNFRQQLSQVALTSSVKIDQIKKAFDFAETQFYEPQSTPLIEEPKSMKDFQSEPRIMKDMLNFYAKEERKRKNFRIPVEIELLPEIEHTITEIPVVQECKRNNLRNFSFPSESQLINKMKEKGLMGSEEGQEDFKVVKYIKRNSIISEIDAKRLVDMRVYEVPIEMNILPIQKDVDVQVNFFQEEIASSRHLAEEQMRSSKQLIESIVNGQPRSERLGLCIDIIRSEKSQLTKEIELLIGEIMELRGKEEKQKSGIDMNTYNSLVSKCKEKLFEGDVAISSQNVYETVSKICKNLKSQEKFASAVKQADPRGLDFKVYDCFVLPLEKVEQGVQCFFEEVPTLCNDEGEMFSKIYVPPCQTLPMNSGISNPYYLGQQMDSSQSEQQIMCAKIAECVGNDQTAEEAMRTEFMQENMYEQTFGAGVNLIGDSEDKKQFSVEGKLTIFELKDIIEDEVKDQSSSQESGSIEEKQVKLYIQKLTTEILGSEEIKYIIENSDQEGNINCALTKSTFNSRNSLRNSAQQREGSLPYFRKEGVMVETQTESKEEAAREIQTSVACTEEVGVQTEKFFHLAFDTNAHRSNKQLLEVMKSRAKCNKSVKFLSNDISDSPLKSNSLLKDLEKKSEKPKGLSKSHVKMSRRFIQALEEGSVKSIKPDGECLGDFIKSGLIEFQTDNIYDGQESQDMLPCCSNMDLVQASSTGRMSDHKNAVMRDSVNLLIHQQSVLRAVAKEMPGYVALEISEEDISEDVPSAMQIFSKDSIPNIEPQMHSQKHYVKESDSTNYLPHSMNNYDTCKMNEIEEEKDYLNSMLENVTYEYESLKYVIQQKEREIRRITHTACEMQRKFQEEVEALANKLEIEQQATNRYLSVIENFRKTESQLKEGHEDHESKIQKILDQVQFERNDRLQTETELLKQIEALKNVISEKTAEMAQMRAYESQQKIINQSNLGMLQQQILKLRHTVEMKEEEILKEKEKYQMQSEKHNDFRKALLVSRDDDEVDGMSVYEKQFERIREIFQSENTRLSNYNVELRLENQHLKSELLEANLRSQEYLKANDSKDKEMRQVRQELAEALNKQASNISETERTLQQRIFELTDQSAKLKEAIKEKDFTINQLTSKRDMLSREHTQENPRSSSRISSPSVVHIDTDEKKESQNQIILIDHIKKLQKLVMKYEARMSIAHISIEDSQDKACSYLKYALEKEREADYLYIQISDNEDKFNSVLTEKIAIQSENIRLSNQIRVSQKKLTAIGSRLLEVAQKDEFADEAEQESFY